MKLLSIVIPSYNYGRFIGELLSSLSEIPEDMMEVIIVDGGSTDNTLEVIKNSKVVPAYIRSHPDGGQAEAINEGFSKATGKWVAFQNSDDYYISSGIRSVVDFLATSEADKYDMVIGGTDFVDEFGKLIVRHSPKPLLKIPFAARNYLHNQALFVKRSLVMDAGGLDESLRFCLDYEWFLRLLSKKPRIKIIYCAVGAQRFHEATKTSNMQTVHDQEFLACRNIYFNRFEIILGKIIDPFYRCFRAIWTII